MRAKRVALEAAEAELWRLGGKTGSPAGRKHILEALRNDLTPTQQKYAEEYYFEGRNIYEISEEYGVSPSTVSRTLKRARQNIYRVMKYSMGRG